MKCSKCDKEASYLIERRTRDKNTYLIVYYDARCTKHIEDIRDVYQEDSKKIDAYYDEIKLKKKSFWRG